MSPTLRRALISALVFFIVFLALSFALQHKNDDFSITATLANTTFVTLLYSLFTYGLRRISGAKNNDKNSNT
jgi:lipopolysaccharide export LptBFGC system permease protein LptF